MTTWTTATPLADFVNGNPHCAGTFEALGLEFCCGGKQPLREACLSKGLEPEAILRRLIAESDKAPPSPGEDFSHWSLTALTDHIVDNHHAYLLEAMPLLGSLLKKVVLRHGERHPELIALATVFDRFASEMRMHLLKEERVLFPAIRRVDAAGRGGASSLGIDGPILRMEAEHDEAGHELQEMRHLTNGYQVPPDACDSFRALYEGLADLETDLHLHVHLENNLLFPRALRAQEGLEETARR